MGRRSYENHALPYWFRIFASKHSSISVLVNRPPGSATTIFWAGTEPFYYISPDILMQHFHTFLLHFVLLQTLAIISLFKILTFVFLIFSLKFIARSYHYAYRSPYGLLQVRPVAFVLEEVDSRFHPYAHVLGQPHLSLKSETSVQHDGGVGFRTGKVTPNTSNEQ